MALQSSGPISLANIAAEFGGSAPHSLSEYYRGGGLVPTNNGNVPTSGAISLGNFYGATNRVQKSITISSNQSNYVLNTAKVSGYVAGVTDLVVTINSGVYISSTSTGGYALNVDTSWAAGDTITIVNNGFIVGMGGAGGSGRSRNIDYGTAGSAGGGALNVSRATSIQNSGTIAGGGGGGGGGGSVFFTDGNQYSPSYGCIGGGGGGGGRSGTTNSAAGPGGLANGLKFLYHGYAGTSGTSSAAGSGGPARTYGGLTSGAGGGGGGWGASGAAGAYTASGAQNGTSGGAGGAAVAGNSNITWVATGTRLGAIT